MYSTISKLQNKHPNGLLIVFRGSTHAKPKSVIPEFYPNVDFAMKGVKELDLVRINIPGTYHMKPNPDLGYSDYRSAMLIPASRLLNRSPI